MNLKSTVNIVQQCMQTCEAHGALFAGIPFKRTWAVTAAQEEARLANPSVPVFALTIFSYISPSAFLFFFRRVASVVTRLVGMESYRWSSVQWVLIREVGGGLRQRRGATT